MKKIIVVLVLLLSFGLSACNNNLLPVKRWAEELPNVFEANDTEATADYTATDSTVAE